MVCALWGLAPFFPLLLGFMPFASNFHGYRPDDILVSFIPRLLDVVISHRAKILTWFGSELVTVPSPPHKPQISVAVDAYNSLSLTSSTENQLHPQLLGGLPFLQVTHSRHPRRPFLPEGTQRPWTCCKKKAKVIWKLL